jgi:hypothetical protein
MMKERTMPSAAKREIGQSKSFMREAQAFNVVCVIADHLRFVIWYHAQEERGIHQEGRRSHDACPGGFIKYRYKIST